MKRILGAIALILLFASISLTGISAARFEFTQPQTPFSAICSSSVDLIIDPETIPARAADVIVTFDPNRIQILDSDVGAPGVQIGIGTAFENYYGNQVNQSTGQIRLAGANMSNMTSTSGVFAVIAFQANQLGNIAFNIQFNGVGQTTDSNIAGAADNLDKLTSVVNLNYGITATNCPIYAGQPEPEEPIDEDPELEIPEEPTEPPTSFPEPGVTVPSPGEQVDPSLPQSRPNPCIVDPNSVGCFLKGDLIIRDLPLPEPVKAVLEEVTLVGVAATAIAITSGASALSLLPLLRSPFLLYLFIASLVTKKRRPWGLILDRGNGSPISFATVRIFEHRSNKLLSTKVSDLEGKYGFVLDKGHYKLEIEHPYYNSVAVEVVIKSKEDGVDLDIVLDKIEDQVQKAEAGKAVKLNAQPLILQRISQALFVGGFLMAVVALWLSPVLFNYLIMGGYILQLAWIVLVAIFTPDRWGSVYLSGSEMIPVANAHVKIYSQEDWQLVDTQMTSKNGKFGFFLEPGKYAIQVAAANTTFPSKSTKNVIKSGNGIPLQELNYDPKRTKKVDIFLDPDEKGTDKRSAPQVQGEGRVIEPSRQTVTQLQNPFGS